MEICSTDIHDSIEISVSTYMFLITTPAKKYSKNLPTEKLSSTSYLYTYKVTTNRVAINKILRQISIFL